MLREILYSEEFKRDVVAQVTERGYSVQEVPDRLGITTKSLYDWRSKFEQPKQQTDQDIEVRKLKAELACVSEERDILKKPPRTSPRMQTSQHLLCNRLPVNE